MNDDKYIGLDVHQATISVAVMDSSGKIIMESILETKAATILEFFAGLHGTLSVTFEEGTWSQKPTTTVDYISAKEVFHRLSKPDAIPDPSECITAFPPFNSQLRTRTNF